MDLIGKIMAGGEALLNWIIDHYQIGIFIVICVVLVVIYKLVF